MGVAGFTHHGERAARWRSPKKIFEHPRLPPATAFSRGLIAYLTILVLMWYQYVTNIGS